MSSYVLGISFDSSVCVHTKATIMAFWILSSLTV